jgi:hypothetical protein
MSTITSCVTTFCYRSVYCSLILNILVSTRIAKCSTNSRKRFRWEVMFQYEHTFCYWIHDVRTCTDLRSWHEHRPSNDSGPDSCVTEEDRWIYNKRVNLRLTSLLCRSSWLCRHATNCYHLFRIHTHTHKLLNTAVSHSADRIMCRI